MHKEFGEVKQGAKLSLLSSMIAKQLPLLEAKWQEMVVSNPYSSLIVYKTDWAHDNSNAIGSLIKLRALGFIEHVIFDSKLDQNYALVFILASNVDEPYSSLLKNHYSKIEPILNYNGINPTNLSQDLYPVLVPYDSKLNNQLLFSHDSNIKLLSLFLELDLNTYEIKLTKLSLVSPSTIVNALNTQENSPILTTNQSLANHSADKSQALDYGLDEAMVVSKEQDGSYPNVVDGQDGVYPNAFNGQDGAGSIELSEGFYELYLVLHEALEHDVSTLTLEHELVIDWGATFGELAKQLILSHDVALFGTIAWSYKLMPQHKQEQALVRMNELLQPIFENLAIDALKDKISSKVNDFLNLTIKIHSDLPGLNLRYCATSSVINDDNQFVDLKEQDSSLSHGNEKLTDTCHDNFMTKGNAFSKDTNQDLLFCCEQGFLEENLNLLCTALNTNDIGGISKDAFNIESIDTLQMVKIQFYDQKLKSALLNIGNIELAPNQSLFNGDDSQELIGEYLSLCQYSHLQNVNTLLWSNYYSDIKQDYYDALMHIESLQAVIIKACAIQAQDHNNIQSLLLLLLSSGFSLQATIVQWLANLAMDYQNSFNHSSVTIKSLPLNNNNKGPIRPNFRANKFTLKSLLNVLLNNDDIAKINRIISYLGKSNNKLFSNPILASYQSESADSYQSYDNDTKAVLSNDVVNGLNIGNYLDQALPKDRLIGMASKLGLFTVLMSNVPNFNLWALPYGAQLSFLAPLCNGNLASYLKKFDESINSSDTKVIPSLLHFELTFLQAIFNTDSVNKSFEIVLPPDTVCTTLSTVIRSYLDALLLEKKVSTKGHDQDSFNSLLSYRLSWLSKEVAQPEPRIIKSKLSAAFDELNISELTVNKELLDSDLIALLNSASKEMGLENGYPSAYVDNLVVFYTLLKTYCYWYSLSWSQSTNEIKVSASLLSLGAILRDFILQSTNKPQVKLLKPKPFYDSLSRINTKTKEQKSALNYLVKAFNALDEHIEIDNIERSEHALVVVVALSALIKNNNHLGNDRLLVILQSLCFNEQEALRLALYYNDAWFLNLAKPLAWWLATATIGQAALFYETLAQEPKLTTNQEQYVNLANKLASVLYPDKDITQVFDKDCILNAYSNLVECPTLILSSDLIKVINYVENNYDPNIADWDEDGVDEIISDKVTIYGATVYNLLLKTFSHQKYVISPQGIQEQQKSSYIAKPFYLSKLFYLYHLPSKNIQKQVATDKSYLDFLEWYKAINGNLLRRSFYILGNFKYRSLKLFTDIPELVGVYAEIFKGLLKVNLLLNLDTHFMSVLLLKALTHNRDENISYFILKSLLVKINKSLNGTAIDKNEEPLTDEQKHNLAFTTVKSLIALSSACIRAQYLKNLAIVHQVASPLAKEAPNFYEIPQVDLSSIFSTGFTMRDPDYLLKLVYESDFDLNNLLEQSYIYDDIDITSLEYNKLLVLGHFIKFHNSLDNEDCFNYIADIIKFVLDKLSVNDVINLMIFIPKLSNKLSLPNALNKKLIELYQNQGPNHSHSSALGLASGPALVSSSGPASGLTLSSDTQRSSSLANKGVRGEGFNKNFDSSQDMTCLFSDLDDWSLVKFFNEFFQLKNENACFLVGALNELNLVRFGKILMALSNTTLSQICAQLMAMSHLAIEKSTYLKSFLNVENDMIFNDIPYQEEPSFLSSCGKNEVKDIFERILQSTHSKDLFLDHFEVLVKEADKLVKLVKNSREYTNDLLKSTYSTFDLTSLMSLHNVAIWCISLDKILKSYRLKDPNSYKTYATLYLTRAFMIALISKIPASNL